MKWDLRTHILKISLNNSSNPFFLRMIILIGINNTFSHPDLLLHTYMMINSAYFHFLLVIPSCIYLLQFHKENCITLSLSRSNLPFFTRIFFHSLVSQWKLIFWRTAKLLKIHDHFRTHIHFRGKKSLSIILKKSLNY